MQQRTREDGGCRRLSLPRALAIACLLVLPGVLLRTLPNVSKFAAGGPTKVETVSAQDDAWTPVPPRLSDRPRLLLALGFAFEISLHVLLITMLLRSPALLALFAALSRPERAAVTAFFAALLAGFLGGSGQTFPFVDWRMYSGQGAPNPRVYLVDGETRAGKTFPVDLHGLAPAIGARRLKLMISEQAKAVSASSGAEGDGLRMQQQKTLHAVGRLYNARHRDSQLVRLRLFAATIPLDATAPPWLRDQRDVISVGIEPEAE